jgi:hypothetical protein
LFHKDQEATKSSRQINGPNEPDLLLLELVRTKDLQALLRLLGSEPLMAASQVLKHFIYWDVLLNFFRNNCI